MNLLQPYSFGKRGGRGYIVQVLHGADIVQQGFSVYFQTMVTVSGFLFLVSNPLFFIVTQIYAICRQRMRRLPTEHGYRILYRVRLMASV